MDLRTHPDFDDHEEISFIADPASGLRAIVARHRIWDSPSVGGCRMRDYAGEAEALADVLRLSRGMTYKSVMAGLDYGGAKAVILGVPPAEGREALFRAMGRAVDRFRGGFRTGVDVGLTPEDVEVMKTRTRFVAGVGAMAPAEATALGVAEAIKASLARRLGSGHLRGRRVALQGLGKVGRRLAELLVADGASVVAADVNGESVARARRDLGIEIVAPEAVHAQAAEVYSPCALGAVINDDTLEFLKAKVIAGSANNQLHEPRHGEILKQRGVLYAPDYVINAGGVIDISHEGRDYDKGKAFAHVAEIHDTLLEIFRRAESEGVPTGEAADRIAEERFSQPEPHSSAAA